MSDLLTSDRLRHWQVDIDADRILWCTADRAEASTNVLSEAVIRELEVLIDHAERERPAGLVIRSAKANSFILGADIGEFDAFEQASEVSEKIREAQAIFRRLEALECPTVATLFGQCLGGGYELALCCDWIVARRDDTLRIGFPEVRLGIFPGLGGVTRGTERLAASVALPLILSGRSVRASEAHRVRLVDELVSPHVSLDWVARRAVRQRRSFRPGLATRLGHRTPVRQLFARVVKRQTATRARVEHYPAPFAALDLWTRHRGRRDDMFEGEAVAVGELMVGDTARALRRLYFLSERLKGLGRAAIGVPPPRRVHVIGAGVMGGDIAAWCVVRGFEVTLQDGSADAIERALVRAKRLYAKRLKTRSAMLAAESRLIIDRDGAGVERADVVIEAIVENADAKRGLYAELEPKMRADALLATNTSALPLDALARDLAEPTRLIGLHFFNPVAQLPLVEIVHHDGTPADLVDRAARFCVAIDKLPLPVRSAPGFLVNRVLAPYLAEALTLMVEGTPVERIDAAAVRFGMPTGPIELADRIGLDVCRDVAMTLAPDASSSVRERLDAEIQAGRLGRKSGAGMYQWKGDRPRRRRLDEPPDAALVERLIAPLLAECRQVAREGLVADEDMLDAGVVFGTGFAPFTGGPCYGLRTGAIGFRPSPDSVTVVPEHPR